MGLPPQTRTAEPDPREGKRPGVVLPVPPARSARSACSARRACEQRLQRAAQDVVRPEEDGAEGGDEEDAWVGGRVGSG